MSSVDPYKILGAKHTDSDEILKKRYKNLLIKYHPDHFSDKMEALYKTNLIIRAYKIIMEERENISYLKSLSQNSYKTQKNKIEFFLKYPDNSFISMFEQNSQIYPVQLNKSDLTYKLYTVSIHYFQLTENLKKEYKKYTLPQKMIIKNSKKIILKKLGDFHNNNYKTLIIYLNIK